MHISKKSSTFAPEFKIMFNKINFLIMKTLLELNAKCTLIAEFKQHAFVTLEGNSADLFNRAYKALLYYDNKEYYYLYLRIQEIQIIKFESMDGAIERLNRFIYNVLSI